MTYAGECVAVCAACGAQVQVPPMAGIPPLLAHKPNCSREGWPILDAIEYDDGTHATVLDWPNGVSHVR